MLRTGTAFEYEPPEGWAELRDGSRYVHQAPTARLQELILQSWLVTGPASPDERAAALDRLVQNGLSALRSTLLAAPFKILRDLASDSSLVVQPAWSTVAVSPEDGTLFCGAVIRGASGVLLLTFEAYSAQCLPIFEQVVRSVRPANGGSGASA
jgi:hypothetical protein